MLKEHAKIFISSLCFVALTATPSIARSCPPDKALYSIDWNDGPDDTKTVFAQQKGEPNGPYAVSFSTTRKSGVVWSMDGEVFCSDLNGLCTLTLQTRDKLKAGIDDVHGKDWIESCKSYVIPVQEITENDQPAYMVFGGLAAFTLSCADLLIPKVIISDALNDFEKQGRYILPPYVRFVSCQE